MIDFVPKTWLEWLPSVGLDDSNDDPRSWLILRLQRDVGKLDFYIEVRRMADLTKRREIVETLIAEGSKFGFKRGSREITDYFFLCVLCDLCGSKAVTDDS